MSAPEPTLAGAGVEQSLLTTTELDRYDEALSDFERAVRLDPQYEVARKNLDAARQRRDDAQG